MTTFIFGYVLGLIVGVLICIYVSKTSSLKRLFLVNNPKREPEPEFNSVGLALMRIQIEFVRNDLLYLRHRYPGISGDEFQAIKKALFGASSRPA